MTTTTTITVVIAPERLNKTVIAVNQRSNSTIQIEKFNFDNIAIIINPNLKHIILNGVTIYEKSNAVE